MGTKKKKKKENEAGHIDHHQKIHHWIIQHIENKGQPNHQHIMPEAQPWHVPNVACWCSPIMTYESITGARIFVHSFIIH